MSPRALGILGKQSTAEATHTTIKNPFTEKKTWTQERVRMCCPTVNDYKQHSQVKAQICEIPEFIF